MQSHFELFSAKIKFVLLYSNEPHNKWMKMKSKILNWKFFKPYLKRIKIIELRKEKCNVIFPLIMVIKKKSRIFWKATIISKNVIFLLLFWKLSIKTILIIYFSFFNVPIPIKFYIIFFIPLLCEIILFCWIYKKPRFYPIYLMMNIIVLLLVWIEVINFELFVWYNVGYIAINSFGLFFNGIFWGLKNTLEIKIITESKI